MREGNALNKIDFSGETVDLSRIGLDTASQQNLSRILIGVVNTGKAETTRKILRAFPYLTNVKTFEGRTLLHLAVIQKDAEMCRVLLECGANPNAPSNNWETALHIAARNGYTEIVRVLVDGGANVSCIDDKGSIALHNAALMERLDTCKLLLELGSDRARKNHDGKSPFSRGNASPDFVRALKSAMAFDEISSGLDEAGPTLLPSKRGGPSM